MSRGNPGRSYAERARKSVLHHRNVQTTTAHYVKSVNTAALRAMDKIDMLIDNGSVSSRLN